MLNADESEQNYLSVLKSWQVKVDILNDAFIAHLARVFVTSEAYMSEMKVTRAANFISR